MLLVVPAVVLPPAMLTPVPAALWAVATGVATLPSNVQTPSSKIAEPDAGSRLIAAPESNVKAPVESISTVPSAVIWMLAAAAAASVVTIERVPCVPAVKTAVSLAEPVIVMTLPLRFMSSITASVMAEFVPSVTASIAPPSMLIASRAALSIKFALVIFRRVPPAPSSITIRSASAMVEEAVMFWMSSVRTLFASDNPVLVTVPAITPTRSANASFLAVPVPPPSRNTMKSPSAMVVSANKAGESLIRLSTPYRLIVPPSLTSNSSSAARPVAANSVWPDITLSFSIAVSTAPLWIVPAPVTLPDPSKDADVHATSPVMAMVLPVANAVAVVALPDKGPANASLVTVPSK